VHLEYRYLGPGGEGIAGLPDGVGAALGSEYCVHLLPSAQRMAQVAREASERGAPLLLLTPYFRDAELKRTIPLFRAIPQGAPVDVAVNDWGALQALHGLFPRMRLSVGRLLSGRKRDPRIGVSTRLTEAGRAWHGEGIFSSPRARAYLEETFGVTGYHVDDLPWSRPVRDGEAGNSRDAVPAGGAPRLFVHAPYALVTVSDACPWIGGVSSSAVASCPRPCRGGQVVLREPTAGGDLLQKGKARFAAFGACGTGRTAPPGPYPLVAYADPP